MNEFIRETIQNMVDETALHIVRLLFDVSLILRDTKKDMSVPSFNELYERNYFVALEPERFVYAHGSADSRQKVSEFQHTALDVLSVKLHAKVDKLKTFKDAEFTPTKNRRELYDETATIFQEWLDEREQRTKSMQGLYEMAMRAIDGDQNH